MTEPILTHCGYRCDLCLAYKPNIVQNPANQEKLSEGWHLYFKFRIHALEIYCEGCMSENPRLIDQSCPVRPCVMEKGLDNCSQCEQYVCEKLTQRLVVFEDEKAMSGAEVPDGDRRGRVRLYAGGEMIGEWAEIPEDDYLCFIRPYENKLRLDAILTSKGKPVSG